MSYDTDTDRENDSSVTLSNYARDTLPVFQNAKKMMPMEQVAQVIEDRKCYNHRKGCKFQTKLHFCTCCMMLRALGSDFFEYLQKLREQVGEDFLFQMTDWQRDEFELKSKYNQKWLDNFPRGAS